MCYFNKETSKEINRLSGKTNQTFGAPYYSTIIKDPRYYLTVYRYVYRNPVEAKICEKVQDYRYSSLKFILGEKVYDFPVFDSPIVEGRDFKNNLDWLNTDYSIDEKNHIRTRLKKPVFVL